MRPFFWLKWKYLWRQGGRGTAALTAVGWLGLGVVAIYLGVLHHRLRVAGQAAGPGGELELVRLWFAAAYLLWLVFEGAGELYDPLRLLTYPVGARRIFAASCATSFVGPKPVFLLAFFIPFVGLSPHPLDDVWRAGVVLLFGIHLTIVARAIRWTIHHWTTTRRWRDVMITVGGLLGVGVLALYWYLRPFSETKSMEDLARAGLSRHLVWDPGLWMGHAMAGPSPWGLAGVGAFAALTGPAILWAAAMQERILRGEPLFVAAPAKAGPVVRGRPFPRGAFAWLGPGAGAIAQKEWLVLARDPGVRQLVVLSMMYALFPVIGFAVAGRSEGGFAPGVDVAAALMVWLQLTMLFLNQLGTDGSALEHVAGSPMPRHRYLLGKNLVHIAVLGTINTALLAGLAVASKALGRLPYAWTLMASSLLASAAIANVYGVLFPGRIVTPGRRASAAGPSQFGCGQLLLRSTAWLALTVILTPVALAMYLLPPYAGLPLALGGAAAVYAASVPLGSWLFSSREERILAFYRVPAD